MSAPKFAEFSGSAQRPGGLGTLRSLLTRLTHPLYLLATLLAVVFLFGGSARPDSLGQLVVVPVSLILLAVGTWRFAGTISAYPMISFLLLAACATILLQLIPLPPSTWFALPGHDQFRALASLTGTADQWRPINLVPQLGWVALAAMLTPAATLLLASGIAAYDRQARPSPTSKRDGTPQSATRGMDLLLVIVILIGIASAVMSVLQLLGRPDGPLYLHRITNQGAAVGFFANRNHNAAFLACLLPLLATWASMPVRNARNLTTRNAALLGAASLVIALILVGGSRAGIGLTVLGGAWSVIIFRSVEVRHVRGENVGLRRLKRAFAVALLVGIVLLTVILSRAQSIDRAIGSDGNSLMLRTDFWPVSWRQALEFFPFGTGLGSFVESYRMVEPLEFLTPYYVNHAHNDWLEIVHGGGVVAALLLAALVVWFTTKLISLFRKGARRTAEGRLALAGAAIVSILGVASFVDYPLRTAPLAALFMLGLVWLSGGSWGRGLAPTWALRDRETHGNKDANSTSPPPTAHDGLARVSGCRCSRKRPTVAEARPGKYALCQFVLCTLVTAGP